MIVRKAHERLKFLLDRFPSVALLGPRQAGKTTLAEDIADELGSKAVYVNLELPSDRAKLSEPELYFAAHENQLVILDEIHRAPGIFQTLRSIIDRRCKKGWRTQQFLFLGSASIELLKQSAESLADRIAYLELTPFLISEIDGEDPKLANRLWVRGGFPDSYLALDDASSFEWRLAFIQAYLARDLPALGPRLPIETVRRFWQMLAHSQGQLLNASRLASGLGVSGQTVARYLDTLMDLFLVRRLPPWSANGSKRLVRSPKVYVRDSGVAHALLMIPDLETLLGHPVAGPSWEGFVIENLLAAAPPGSKAWFYRTAEGAEIDLLLELGAAGRWAIEVKRSLSNPKPSKGFHLASDDVKATRQLVVYPGQEPYRIDAKTEVMPLDRLVRSLSKTAEVSASAG
ncbi:MAG TPA: ATP-binding protein [Bryobacteraceae bacterium]